MKTINCLIHNSKTYSVSDYYDKAERTARYFQRMTRNDKVRLPMQNNMVIKSTPKYNFYGLV